MKRIYTRIIQLALFAGLAGAILAAEPINDYLEYPSSVDPDLRLFARFSCVTDRGVLLVRMHGWHGQSKTYHSDNLVFAADERYFVIEPEMRGRGDAEGNPDCSGWELQDVIDAVKFARVHYADRIASPEVVYFKGGSGGGGNGYALVGKFPDFFTAAQIGAGISDYALWHTNDHIGEFRDELEGTWEDYGRVNKNGWKAWIGASPVENPEAYRSRSGLTTVGNLLTPVFVYHGANDARVPVDHARLWVGAAQGQGVGRLVDYLEMAGVGGRRHFEGETSAQASERVARGNRLFDLNRAPPELPARGSLVVAGYLKTARFEVVLESINHVGRIDYDMEGESFAVFSQSSHEAILTVISSHGEAVTREVLCQR